jgi:inhibitor of KinA sporulation pathway (predicted exonuclease)
VIIDFEATCDNSQYPKITADTQECIEFPFVVVELCPPYDATHDEEVPIIQIVDEFQYYVKPEWSTELTEFCTELTGITNDQINSGISLRECINLFNEYVQENFISKNKSFCIITDGQWDLKQLLLREATKKNIPLAPHFKRFFDLRREYKLCFPELLVKGLYSMVNHAGVDFVGRHHSGFDDCMTICNLVAVLLYNGHMFREENIIAIEDDYNPVTDSSFTDFNISRNPTLNLHARDANRTSTAASTTKHSAITATTATTHQNTAAADYYYNSNSDYYHYYYGANAPPGHYNSNYHNTLFIPDVHYDPDHMTFQQYQQQQMHKSQVGTKHSRRSRRGQRRRQSQRNNNQQQNHHQNGHHIKIRDPYNRVTEDLFLINIKDTISAVPTIPESRAEEEKNAYTHYDHSESLYYCAPETPDSEDEYTDEDEEEDEEDEEYGDEEEYNEEQEDSREEDKEDEEDDSSREEETAEENNHLKETDGENITIPPLTTATNLHDSTCEQSS